MTACKWCSGGLCVRASSCQKVVYQAHTVASVSYICSGRKKKKKRKSNLSMQESCWASLILFLFSRLIAFPDLATFPLSPRQRRRFKNFFVCAQLSSKLRFTLTLLTRVCRIVPNRQKNTESKPSRRKKKKTRRSSCRLFYIYLWDGSRCWIGVATRPCSQVQICIFSRVSESQNQSDSGKEDSTAAGCQ